MYSEFVRVTFLTLCVSAPSSPCANPTLEPKSAHCVSYCWDNPMIKEIQDDDQARCAHCSRTGDTLVLEYSAWFEQPCMGAEKEVEQLRAFYKRVDPANARDAVPLIMRYPLHSIAAALRKKYPASAVPDGARWARRVCRETFESRLHNDPRVVVLGKFNVTGVDVSLTGMCPGDTRVLRVPAALG